MTGGGREFRKEKAPPIRPSAKDPKMSKLARETIIWIARIIIYPAMGYLGLAVIMPAFSSQIVGLLLAAPTAAIALGLDLWITAWGKKKTLGEVATSRALIIDHLLSEPGESVASKRARELETTQVVEAEIEQPDQQDLLPPGR
jgi:hypothetical protein